MVEIPSDGDGDNLGRHVIPKVLKRTRGQFKNKWDFVLLLFFLKLVNFKFVITEY